MKIIYLYNQLGAGPLMISSLLINELKSSDDVIVIVNNRVKIDSENQRVCVFKSYDNLFLRLLVRFFIEIFYIPYLSIKYGVNSILAFGNFNLIPYPVNKSILIHHPYLVDDAALMRLPVKSRIIEYIKRFYFKLQTYIFKRNSYIAQTIDFKNRIENMYNVKNVKLIPNPVTNKINFPSECDFKKILYDRIEQIHEFNMVYVSRFYPHKNHVFLLKLAREIQKRKLKVKISITVDIDTLPSEMKEELAKSDVIFNIGEVDQEVLSSIYLKSHVCIFPSLTETFGNGLVESAKFGLPVLAFDFPYVKNVLGDNVIYIHSIDSCINEVESFVKQPSAYETKSKEVYKYSSSFLNVSEWKELLIK